MTSEDLWPLSTYNNQKCHKWFYTQLCIFFDSNPMAPTSNGYFNIPQGHQGITSSRVFIKAKGQVSIPNTNESIKQSLVILMHIIPPREYWQFILKGDSRGSSKTIFQVSVLHQSTLATTFIQYSLDASRPVFSFIHHGKFIQPSSFPNFARYTLHEAVNKASRIKYRPAVSLKESSSQPFAYTSLL
ncbi:hypothetical protein O181_032792 [Austropuccinia psidii MF-1]|uniref:Uncharacterized protein n=1 Tax=Austropuccinia psidii MF-1 TaxID=1389203 RepID=A0A9Q3H6K1_9BASI|nr:hypothetical protein [Austropuccinia psidii MF-1]